MQKTLTFINGQTANTKIPFADKSIARCLKINI